jgi:hypothetical protein
LKKPARKKRNNVWAFKQKLSADFLFCFLIFDIFYHKTHIIKVNIFHIFLSIGLAFVSIACNNNASYQPRYEDGGQEAYKIMRIRPVWIEEINKIRPHKTFRDTQDVNVYYFKDKNGYLSYRYPRANHLELYNNAPPESLFIIKFETPGIDQDYLLYNQKLYALAKKQKERRAAIAVDDVKKIQYLRKTLAPRGIVF